ncbi:MAG: hypothetical protein ACRD5J_04985 [Nitrososphaeraceae archaeon]
MPLILGEMIVDDGENVNFTACNSVTVTVSNNNSNALNIITVGFENDGISEVLPIMTPIFINQHFLQPCTHLRYSMGVCIVW